MNDIVERLRSLDGKMHELAKRFVGVDDPERVFMGAADVGLVASGAIAEIEFLRAALAEGEGREALVCNDCGEPWSADHVLHGERRRIEPDPIEMDALAEGEGRDIGKPVAWALVPKEADGDFDYAITVYGRDPTGDWDLDDWDLTPLYRIDR